ncbi:NAD(P)H-dependent flavin oxidoreductase [Pseudochelatococcus sp. G4_1912]|uniref:NAD(P)H-dependent flavin oxidoreductase n=1 Tax=Pseudochelatococcus sp. G4_1912 TaxID=3114288 RepID=UPI0039C5D077
MSLLSKNRAILGAEHLTLPVIAAPMFLVSGPELVIAQCKAGVIGSFPSLNARPVEMLDQWLTRISQELREHDLANPDKLSAPFAVNLIVHRSNSRLEEDLALVVKHKVPLVITSLGAREDVNAAVHSYGGKVLHDVINTTFARKAIEKGADGLIAVAAGAGGHAGTWSPFALVEEIRAWWDGPLALSGAIATGRGVLAAQAAGADFAYIGSAFIATKEAQVSQGYKDMIVASGASDIVYTDIFTGVSGNYLKPSLVASGIDPDQLSQMTPQSLETLSAKDGSKAWRDIWGAGQGIGAIKDVPTVAGLVVRLKQEYDAQQACLSA